MANSIAPRIFVAPTEPALLKAIGKVTLLPETMGCDVLVYSYSPLTIIGYQRKELDDFLHSLADGRLAKEIGQMADSPLTYKLLIIEGTPQWTNDGYLASQFNQSMTKSGYLALLTSIQTHGIILHTTSKLSDTIDTVRCTSSYLAKPTHNALLRRPKESSRNSWGRITSSAFGSHLLQSFPGIGPTAAKSIFDKFGRVPLQWNCSLEELVSIPGIGKKTAEKLIASLAEGSTK